MAQSRLTIVHVKLSRLHVKEIWAFFGQEHRFLWIVILLRHLYQYNDIGPGNS